MVFTKDELREWQIAHDHRSSPGIADSMTADEVFVARVVAFALAQMEAREEMEVRATDYYANADHWEREARAWEARAEAAEAALQQVRAYLENQSRAGDACASLLLAAHKEDRGE